jgi:DNA-binding MarR family transcriptional regulator
VEDLTRSCLGFRLGAVYRRIDRLFGRAYGALGLPYAHAQILLCLLEAGELHVRDLAARTGYDRSTVSRLAHELIRRRLVRHKPDPDDGRMRLLMPAKRTHDLAPEMAQVQKRVNERLRRTLVSADVEGLLRVTEQLERLP